MISDSFHIGQGWHWIEWVQSGTVQGRKTQRCQVAAFQQHLDQFVIASVSGKKLADMSFDLFEAAVKDESIVLLERIDRFDQTLAAVIDGMRKS